MNPGSLKQNFSWLLSSFTESKIQSSSNYMQSPLRSLIVGVGLKSSHYFCTSDKKLLTNGHFISASAPIGHFQNHFHLALRITSLWFNGELLFPIKSLKSIFLSKKHLAVAIFESKISIWSSKPVFRPGVFFSLEEGDEPGSPNPYMLLQFQNEVLLGSFLDFIEAHLDGATVVNLETDELKQSSMFVSQLKEIPDNIRVENRFEVVLETVIRKQIEAVLPSLDWLTWNIDEVCRNIQGWYDFFHASQSQQLSMLQLLFFEIKEAEQAAASYNLSELQYSATKTILMTNTES